MFEFSWKHLYKLTCSISHKSPLELWVCVVIYGAGVNNIRMTFSPWNAGVFATYIHLSVHTRASSCSIKCVGEKQVSIIQIARRQRHEGKQSWVIAVFVWYVLFMFVNITFLFNLWENNVWRTFVTYIINNVLSMVFFSWNPIKYKGNTEMRENNLSHHEISDIGNMKKVRLMRWLFIFHLFCNYSMITYEVIVTLIPNQCVMFCDKNNSSNFILNNNFLMKNVNIIST